MPTCMPYYAKFPNCSMHFLGNCHPNCTTLLPNLFVWEWGTPTCHQANLPPQPHLPPFFFLCMPACWGWGGVEVKLLPTLCPR